MLRVILNRKLANRFCSIVRTDTEEEPVSTVRCSSGSDLVKDR